MMTDSQYKIFVKQHNENRRMMRRLYNLLIPETSVPIRGPFDERPLFVHIKKDEYDNLLKARKLINDWFKK